MNNNPKIIFLLFSIFNFQQNKCYSNPYENTCVESVLITEYFVVSFFCLFFIGIAIWFGTTLSGGGKSVYNTVSIIS